MSMQLADKLSADDEVELIELTRETGWKLIVVKTTLFLIQLFFFLPGYIRKYDVDIVLFSSMVTGSVAHFIRKRVNVPMVCINHGHDVTLRNKPYQWLVPKIFRALDGVISVSSATRLECLNRGLDPSKSKVLPNGFDVRDLEQNFSKEKSRKVLEEQFVFKLGNRKLLLTVGRLIKRKGHEWFIRETLPEIKSDVVYLIIGDGAEYNSIASAIEESTRKDNIMLVGRQSDEILRHAYTAADLFIMPNIKVEGDMEGFGVVLLEANIRKTPAIASSLEGIKDVILNGINGYRIEPGDVQTFADKIDDVLRDKLVKLSETSKEYAENEFSWDKVAKAYKAHLKSVVEQYNS